MQLPVDSIPDPERRRRIGAFFFWAAWACGTNRPGQANTYTSNWLAESLIANSPTGATVVWSMVSFIALLAGVGALVWHHGSTRKDPADQGAHAPERDPLFELKPTPSMRATLKYFWIVGVLILGQMAMGAVAAHYGVEGSGFYGNPLATAFWAMNIGLALMVLLSLLPIGLMQTWASVEKGLWYARSPEFMQTSIMQTLRWLRVIGDSIFAVGMVAMGWFVTGLTGGWSRE